jgi:hypothetical protein
MICAWHGEAARTAHRLLPCATTVNPATRGQLAIVYRLRKAALFVTLTAVLFMLFAVLVKWPTPTDQLPASADPVYERTRPAAPPWAQYIRAEFV